MTAILFHDIWCENLKELYPELFSIAMDEDTSIDSYLDSSWNLIIKVSKCAILTDPMKSLLVCFLNMYI